MTAGGVLGVPPAAFGCTREESRVRLDLYRRGVTRGITDGQEIMNSE
jgi:hypothetical protein